MFAKIVVAVDGSETSRAAVEKSLAIAQAFGSEVILVSVIDSYAFTRVGVDGAYGQADYLAAATKEAHASVDAARSRFEAQGTRVATSVVEGQAVHKGILDAADAAGADLIVMGSHGREGLEKILLGSVASQVLSETRLSVLVVRH